MGYHRAGFDVVGVDIKPQPHYPFEFLRADAVAGMERMIAGGTMEWKSLSFFDAIHASPPCQAYSSATKAWGRTEEHPDVYAVVRRQLVVSGLPWVIENVIGAPYHHGVILCGSMFGLEVQRHRMFETSHLILMDMQCQHTGRSLTVTGHSPYWWAQGERIQATTADINAAMGIDWMNRREIVQAIPPAYTEWIGHQLMAHLDAERVA